MLAKFAHVSQKTLQRHFYTHLTSSPQPQKLARSQEIWLKVDATYFKDWGCLIVYKAGKDILYWQYAEREYYGAYEAGLRWLTNQGYIIRGVTSDWHGSIISSIERTLPHIPHQRCLVHTQRLCQSLLTQHPKTEAGWMLLQMIRELNHVQNHYEARIWMRWLCRWHSRYSDFIRQRAYATKDDGIRTWWYVHKNLRRAFLTVWTTQEHLFLYLDYEGLEKDTNGLEAEFKSLKAKIRSHTGLRKTERRTYISWYLFFKSH